MQKVGPSLLRSQMLLVADTALSGDAAEPMKHFAADGLSGADQGSGLQAASVILLRLRMYPQVASLLGAAVRLFPDQAQQLSARGEMFSRVMAQDRSKWNQKTPTGAFLCMLAAISSGKFDEQRPQLVAKEVSRDNKDTAFNPARNERSTFEAMQRQSGLSGEAMVDTMASLVNPMVDTNPDGGARLRLNMPRASRLNLYFSNEAGTFKFIGEDRELSALGKHILTLTAENNFDAARKWLNWIREDLKLQGGEDPFAGPLFPRLWAKNDSGDATHIRAAGAALLLHSAPDTALGIFGEALHRATDGRYKESLQFAYGQACVASASCKDGLRVLQPLATTYPDSQVITRLVLDFMARESNWTGYEQMVKAGLARDPDEVAYRRFRAAGASLRGEFEQSASLWLAIAKSPKGEIGDWNNFGWNLVLSGTTDAGKLKQFEEGLNALTNQNSRPGAPVLHTLAALYADLGKVTEAKETILRAMLLWQIEEPNEECWLIFGQIAEQLGARETAIGDFKQVNAPKVALQANLTSYAVAKRRLARLEAEGKAAANGGL